MDFRRHWCSRCCPLFVQVSVRGGTRRPEETRQSQEWRRQHAATALAGLKPQKLRSRINVATRGNTDSSVHTKRPSCRKSCCGFWIYFSKDRRLQRRGYSPGQKSCWCSSIQDVYLFSYMSSANSRNCKYDVFKQSRKSREGAAQSKQRCRECGTFYRRFKPFHRVKDEKKPDIIFQGDLRPQLSNKICFYFDYFCAVIWRKPSIWAGRKAQINQVRRWWAGSTSSTQTAAGFNGVYCLFFSRSTSFLK